MIDLLTTFLLFLIFLLSCTTNEIKVKNELHKDTSFILTNSKNRDTILPSNYFKIDKDSITMLPFEIAVNLSPRAKDKLFNSKETIMVNVSLTGTPKDTTLYSEDGDFYIASSEKEISYGKVAKFNNVKFSKKMS